MKKFILLIFVVSIIYGQEIPKAEDWHWEKYPDNPVLKGGSGSDWDAGRIYPGTVLKIDGLYHMWYCGIELPISNGFQSIGYATSPDGKNWTKYQGNPVLDADGSFPEEKNVGYPEVYYDGETFHMWYYGYRDNYSGQIGYASSEDGMNWSKYENNPVVPFGDAWDSYLVAMPAVIPENNGFRMWYLGGSSSICKKIGTATSSDGLSWEKLTDPILELCQDEVRFWGTSLIKTSYGNYYMWYSEGEWDVSPGISIRYAYSSDGLEWTQTPNYSVLVDGFGPRQGWEIYNQNFPAVLYNEEDDIYEMWYGGSKFNLDESYVIGYAWAPNPVDTTTNISENKIIPDKYFLSQNYPNPFNPGTVISYQISVTSDVHLRIYDVLGREVATLVNEKQSPGNYEVKWDGSKQYSGIYFYKITAGKYSETKKMVLLK